MNGPHVEPLEAAAHAEAKRWASKQGIPGAKLTLHPYRFPDGKTSHWHVRLKDRASGRKEVRPMHHNGERFVWCEPPKPEAGKLIYRLPDLLAADPSDAVWIVEGEHKADLLALACKVAITNGAADTVDSYDWSPLRGRRMRLWHDNDESGRRWADKVEAILRALGCVVERVDVSKLVLPEKGDVVDWAAMHGPNDPQAKREWLAEAMPAMLDALPLVQRAEETVEKIAPPEPLPDPLPSVPKFNPEWLPESVRAWCADHAEGLQVPLDFTAIPALVALAGAIGRGVAVSMKRNGGWYERPVLWGCVIGRPSSGKSPALSPARRMLERLAGEDRAAYEAEMREHEARELLSEAERADTKKKIQKAIAAGKKDEAEGLAFSAAADEEAPTEPRIVVNDATVEKLGELLNANPRGLVQFRDELAGWLASLDREGRESDRAFWLECWNGSGAFTVDRIGRGTVRIEACAVSILGGMQPGKLAEYVRGAVRGGFSDDGLMQRFQLAVYPDLSKSWKYNDMAPSPCTEAKAYEAFRRLRAMTPEAIGAEHADTCDVPFLRFDDEAQGLFIEWMTEHMQRLRAGDEPAWMESHLAKFPGMVGRLSLVMHLADGGIGPIPADVLVRVLDLCTYLEGHARRIYSPATDSGLTAAHALLRKRGEIGEAFTARDVYRKCWAGLSDPDEVADALAVLRDHGWLVETVTNTGGRPTVQFAWRGEA